METGSGNVSLLVMVMGFLLWGFFWGVCCCEQVLREWRARSGDLAQPFLFWSQSPFKLHLGRLECLSLTVGSRVWVPSKLSMYVGFWGSLDWMMSALVTHGQAVPIAMLNQGRCDGPRSLEKEEMEKKKNPEKNVLWIILCSAIFVTSLFTYFETWCNSTQSSLKITVWLSMTLLFLPSFLKCWDYRHMLPLSAYVVLRFTPILSTKLP